MKTLLIAHRGASAYAPENTLKSFKKAIQMKAKAIELDVRLSKDKKLMVIHDKKLKRIAEIKGKVKDYSAKQLKNFNIPSLQDVFDLIKGKKIILFIEMKEHGIERKLLEIIKKNNAGKKVVIVSFYWNSLKKIKRLNRDIRISYNFLSKYAGLKAGRIKKLKLRPVKSALKINADYISPKYKILTKKMIENAHKNGLKVWTWTINSKQKAKKLIKMGIDGIASNKPDLL